MNLGAPVPIAWIFGVRRRIGLDLFRVNSPLEHLLVAPGTVPARSVTQERTSLSADTKDQFEQLVADHLKARFPEPVADPGDAAADQRYTQTATLGDRVLAETDGLQGPSAALPIPALLFPYGSTSWASGPGVTIRVERDRG